VSLLESCVDAAKRFLDKAGCDGVLGMLERFRNVGKLAILEFELEGGKRATVYILHNGDVALEIVGFELIRLKEVTDE